ncbi:hypothetical protein ACIBCM_17325 [Streptomyces sp. NPDC051018]|uniref:hypothetical protein n=1 Tax=Streptomyces sp. NPDC051018 TaxID=3365639 RepID=UPI00378CF71F
MGASRATGVLVLGPLLILVLVAAGCRSIDEPAFPKTSGPVSPSTGHGPVFLGTGDCGSRGKDFREVPCTSEKALARVLARHGGRPADGPACPVNTDFVLHISESRVTTDEDGDGIVGQGYACMRNLEPPHPGDPGGGGGPHTVIGDCVYEAGAGRVKETACDGSGKRPPEFRIRSAVAKKAQCPPSTDLYVRLRAEKPVGCAHRVPPVHSEPDPAGVIRNRSERAG